MSDFPNGKFDLEFQARLLENGPSPDTLMAAFLAEKNKPGPNLKPLAEEDSKPVAILVKLGDGRIYSLTGHKLVQFLQGVRATITFAQDQGYKTEPWEISDWDKVTK